MKDLIDRQDAIVALRNVWNALWEIDIPSPTVPEYIEHHEQVQGIMKMVQDMIDTLPCTESQRESVQEIIYCKDCKHYTKEFGWNGTEYTVCSEKGHHCSLVSADDYCSRAERRMDG